MFRPCFVARLSVTNYRLKENIQKVKAAVKKVFASPRDVNLLTLKFRMLDFIAENESRYDLLNYLDASSNYRLNSVTITTDMMILIRKRTTPKKRLKVLSRLTSHDDNPVLKI